jgi:hypothetical protein
MRDSIYGNAMRLAYGGSVAANPDVEARKRRKQFEEDRDRFSSDYQSLYSRILSEIGSIGEQTDMRSRARLGTLQGYLKSLEDPKERRRFVDSWRQGLVPGLSGPPKGKPQMKSFINKF